MSDGARGRLERCIRDLAALHALPSMCIGRSHDEALEIVIDTLPTALSCELVVLEIGPHVRAKRSGLPARDDEIAALAAAVRAPPDADGAITIGAQRVWCLTADLPVGGERGCLHAAYAAAPDPETDRVLVRSAANVVGTTLETANVLDAATRKDEFLAMLGHELRNPLGPIVTAAELLAHKPAVEREQKIIERHTRHLARLVDDLLDISRVSRGQIALRSEPVTLASVLEHAVESAGPLITHHHHELRVGVASDITVSGDPVRLAQIFGNLLGNAAKFTPPHGRIDITIAQTPSRVRVTVTDNGRGIAREQLTRIFEPFVQVDRAADALRGGLGLGLAIVKNLVHLHAGTITVTSPGPGRGATFTVELPTIAPVSERPLPAQPMKSSARAGIRVLVVDDNADLAELLSEALTFHGFETAIEHTADAALARWRTFAPHAAVLDVGLPDRDGYELARALRAEHGPGPTLIAATGYGQDRDRTAASDAGFDLHLVKPVSIDDLITALDDRVVRPRE